MGNITKQDVSSKNNYLSFIQVKRWQNKTDQDAENCLGLKTLIWSQTKRC